MAQANNHVKADSAANSEIIIRNKSPSDLKELTHELIELQKEIQTKNAMLETAASAGQQLVTENDGLLIKLANIAKILKEKEDENETLRKTNDMLKITATRSGAESDELHKKWLESVQKLEQLREEYALLKLMHMNDTSSMPRTPSDSFDKHSANDLISQLTHEKKALEEFLLIEQAKCGRFLQNAEMNARQLSHKQNENQDLKAQISELQNENNALTHNTEQEMAKYTQTLCQLQSENEALQQQLYEQQQIAKLHSANMGSMHRHLSLHSNDDLHTNLEEMGYFEFDERTESTSFSMHTPTSQFHKATVDAQEEFFRLTVIAAKIKFNDIPISTAVLWEKVKEANLSFHEVADWLNEYLLSEREKQNEQIRNARITSITAQTEKNAPRDFFSKIKDLADSVTNFSSTLRLEVRFGRRVFEVKMKKNDKLETLVQTLPRIIGEDADSMQIFHGKNKLDVMKSLMELGLNNNDILRMLHKEKAVAYLRRYEKKLSDDISGIEMESETLQNIDELNKCK